MRLPGLLMMIVAVPAAAAWLYFIGQSAAAIVSLLDEPVAAGEETPVVATPRASIDAAEEAPSVGDASAGAAATPAARIVSAPAQLAATPAPAVYADDAAVTPIEHPEITDPRIRALLQPAWDD